MKKIWGFCLLFFFIVSMCTALYAQPQQAHDFVIKDISGNDIKLSDHKGKVIFLNFFATWCPPCRMEMPDFNDIAKAYPDDVAVIAINVDNEPELNIREFVNEQGLVFPVCVDTQGLSQLYGPIRAIPVTIVIDKDFLIAERYVGARSRDVFEEDIKRLQ
ncbi:MAG: TlpA disulfide reductase family protein [Candidatus Omnitrophica bacterium]|nr:TlpA disulfide reductase family protein [Candidatus Omnitrophota bacterium]